MARSFGYDKFEYKHYLFWILNILRIIVENGPKTQAAGRASINPRPCRFVAFVIDFDKIIIYVFSDVNNNGA